MMDVSVPVVCLNKSVPCGYPAGLNRFDSGDRPGAAVRRRLCQSEKIKHLGAAKDVQTRPHGTIKHLRMGPFGPPGEHVLSMHGTG